MKDKTLNCHDCNFNVIGFNPEFKPEDFQYCMIQDDLWAKISNKNKVKILCISCMETRLGRKLNPEDYKISPTQMLSRMINYIRS